MDISNVVHQVAMIELHELEESQVSVESVRGWCVEEQAMEMDIAVLQQVEELERKVTAASLQVKVSTHESQMHVPLSKISCNKNMQHLCEVLRSKDKKLTGSVSLPGLDISRPSVRAGGPGVLRAQAPNQISTSLGKYRRQGLQGSSGGEGGEGWGDASPGQPAGHSSDTSGRSGAQHREKVPEEPLRYHHSDQAG